MQKLNHHHMTRLTILLILVFCNSCKKESKNELPKTNNNSNVKPVVASFAPSSLIFALENEKYAVDSKESVVTWKGSNAIGFKGGHTGYVYISTGILMIKKNRLAGGEVEVDMNTIADKDHGTKNGLVDHLKSPDFFDVEKFPLAKFTITKVEAAGGENVKVTGDLTIKGITHEVTFPAIMDIKDGVAKAMGTLTIDRTQWGVRYKSGTFFSNLADDAISDSIEFEMKIVAKKSNC
jgi:polyisoprenoid-binding protein YceI